MNKPKIYLDNCTFNRPFDDQGQMKIRLETEAKLYIQAGVKEKRYTLVWSYMLDYENDVNPYDERRDSIAPWADIANEYCPSSDEILSMGTTIMSHGIKTKDALHIACSIHSNFDYFITTDKKLLNKSIEGIKIVSPIDFVSETED
ncbi:MAG: hypothetical protein LBM60_01425 [Clostridium sp.]|jgi:hypothetical protein|nr:hypothetical protein [Clostridium sp.]